MNKNTVLANENVAKGKYYLNCQSTFKTDTNFTLNFFQILCLPGKITYIMNLVLQNVGQKIGGFCQK